MRKERETGGFAIAAAIVFCKIGRLWGEHRIRCGVVLAGQVMSKVRWVLLAAVLPVPFYFAVHCGNNKLPFGFG